MTLIIDRMESAMRRYLNRWPRMPVAVLINPVDDLRLDLEYQWLRPASSPYRSVHDPAPPLGGLRDKRFKGLPVLCDLRVPEGCVAVRFKPFPSVELLRDAYC